MKKRRRTLRRDQLAVSIAGEEHARFFEAFANRRDPVLDWRLLPLESSCAAGELRVIGIERAAGKDVRTAEECRVLRPLQHQCFRAACRVAQEDKSGRGARDDLQVVRAARSFSFCALITARMRSQSASLSLSSSVK